MLVSASRSIKVSLGRAQRKTAAALPLPLRPFNEINYAAELNIRGILTSKLENAPPGAAVDTGPFLDRSKEEERRGRGMKNLESRQGLETKLEKSFSSYPWRDETNDYRLILRRL